MSDTQNRVVSLGQGYRVYSTGFMGSDEVALTPEVEIEKSLSYGAGLMRTNTNTFKHRACVKTNELKKTDHDIVTNVFLYDQLIKLSLMHFGPNIQEWIQMHDTKLCRESTLCTAENVAWIKETLELVAGLRTKRVMTAATWIKLVRNSGTISSQSVERQLHDTIKKVPASLLKTNTFLSQWSRVPGGVSDLRDSIFMMYGEV